MFAAELPSSNTYTTAIFCRQPFFLISRAVNIRKVEMLLKHTIKKKHKGKEKEKNEEGNIVTENMI